MNTAYQAWRDMGLLWVLRAAPERMRNARLAAGKNDLALLVDINPASRGTAVWRWLTRVELLCVMVETAPWAKDTLAALAEPRPDPAIFPVVGTLQGEGVFTAMVDMTDVKESVGLN